MSFSSLVQGTLFFPGGAGKEFTSLIPRTKGHARWNGWRSPVSDSFPPELVGSREARVLWGFRVPSLKTLMTARVAASQEAWTSLLYNVRGRPPTNEWALGQWPSYFYWPALSTESISALSCCSMASISLSLLWSMRWGCREGAVYWDIDEWRLAMWGIYQHLVTTYIYRLEFLYDGNKQGNSTTAPNGLLGSRKTKRQF